MAKESHIYAILSPYLAYRYLSVIAPYNIRAHAEVEDIDIFNNISL